MSEFLKRLSDPLVVAGRRYDARRRRIRVAATVVGAVATLATAGFFVLRIPPAADTAVSTAGGSREEPTVVQPTPQLTPQPSATPTPSLPPTSVADPRVLSGGIVLGGELAAYGAEPGDEIEGAIYWDLRDADRNGFTVGRREAGLESIPGEPEVLTLDDARVVHVFNFGSAETRLVEAHPGGVLLELIGRSVPLDVLIGLFEFVHYDPSLD